MTTSNPIQDEVNQAVYFSPGVYSHYLSQQLTRPEVFCLLKYQQYFAGKDVLDIGVGAGRTTGYLAPLAHRYEGLDYSPVMVEYARKTMPDISVHQANFRDLSIFKDESFDFVFATNNVIDALAHEDRQLALREACRVLREGQILVLTSHNIRYKKAYSGPELEFHRNPVTFARNIVRYLRRLDNHRRIGRLRVTHEEYALINDTGHDYACLHYYTARPTMEACLKGVGLRLLEVFGSGGESLTESQDDSGSPSLLYVAAKQSPGVKNPGSENPGSGLNTVRLGRS